MAVTDMADKCKVYWQNSLLLVRLEPVTGV